MSAQCFPSIFIFYTSASFSCQVRARLQADHVFVSVCLSFYACLRLYQLHGGKKNAECTVLRRVSLNYSTSLLLNSWFTLLSNTIMIVPPIEERVFLCRTIFFFPITFEARGNTSCLCAVFRVTLYLKKKVCG